MIDDKSPVLFVPFNYVFTSEHYRVMILKTFLYVFWLNVDMQLVGHRHGTRSLDTGNSSDHIMYQSYQGTTKYLTPERELFKPKITPQIMR